jgi:DNA-binding transcriptional ArsR family regulator
MDNSTPTPTPDLDLMLQSAAKAEAMMKLLANARRLMILCHLVEGEKSVGQLADLVGLSQSALSQHLSKMKMLNLVKADKQGQMVFYSISNPEVEAILATLHSLYCKT